MAEFLVEVTGQEVEIILGLHDFERHAPQRVVISVQVLTADLTGDAGGFMDYDAIVAHIRSYAGQRIETQEELILAIHSYVSGLPHVARARVSSRKPDIFNDVDWVGLSYPARSLFT
ncbi:dihydroneopterin aldolase [Falsigemmobacter faecalis]|uniref:dihydroneopterin aldolase n=1 Tax=Falsigemmobacter faecalis TaxID=2488730 RepID=UPI0013155375|nr:dihydroneopterin aldolase [Falsigemmobacter faecalis]